MKRNAGDGGGFRGNGMAVKFSIRSLINHSTQPFKAFMETEKCL